MNQWISRAYVFIFIGLFFGMTLAGCGGGDDPKALAQREGLKMVAEKKPEWQEAKNPGKIKITEVFVGEFMFGGKGVRFKGEFTPQCDLYNYNRAVAYYNTFYGLPDSLARQHKQLAQDVGNHYIIEVRNPRGEPFALEGSFPFLKNEKDRLVLDLKSSDLEANKSTGYSLEYLKKTGDGNRKFYLKGSKEAEHCVSDLQARINAFTAKIKKFNELSKQEQDCNHALSNMRQWKLPRQERAVNDLQQRLPKSSSPDQVRAKLEKAKKELDATKQEQIKQEELLKSIQAEIEQLAAS